MPPERVRGDLRWERERTLRLTPALRRRPLAAVIAFRVVVVAARLSQEGGHHVGGLGGLGRGVAGGLGLDKVGDARAEPGVVWVFCKR